MDTNEQSLKRRLSGKVCVIAGAAGAIGEGVAKRLKAEGGVVVGIDQKEHSTGDLSLLADLRVETEVKDAYARVHREFGRVDVIYNNAGHVDPADHSALEISTEVWNRIFAANLTTTWLSCKHGIPLMLRNQPVGGSVINTTSFLAGMGAASAQMAFSAAKAAVAQLSRDLGVNLARSGVRVNALSLGPIETPQLKTLFDNMGPEQVSRRFTHMPMGRFGTLNELAATVAYLASDDAGFVTASIFPINGGIPGAYTVPT
jgi:NAD(P)-dependent dehydrogenase (short-subunit alcohol dehydrogenase family)